MSSDLEEHLADPIDVGTRLAELDRESRLAAQRLLAQPKQFKVPKLDDDGEPVFDDKGQPVMVWPHPDCVNEDCGEPIDPRRLEHGYDTCIHCATAAEERRKRYAK